MNYKRGDIVDGKELLEYIQGYSYSKARLEETKKKLESITPKITPTYGMIGGRASGINRKVENMGNRRVELELKAAEHQNKIDNIYRLIECSGLDQREKPLMWWVARNGKLQAYARRERIGRDNVYKIRDRAVKKMLAYNKTQNVV